MLSHGGQAGHASAPERCEVQDKFSYNLGENVV